ncbi:MAG: hypothetical protein AABM29_00090 [Actinomycetota bacterium]
MGKFEIRVTERRTPGNGFPEAEALGSTTDTGTVEASGSASVEATTCASVEATGSSSVEATTCASVEATSSSSVEATTCASVEATSSSSVEAEGDSDFPVAEALGTQSDGSPVVEALGTTTDNPSLAEQPQAEAPVGRARLSPLS